MANLAASIVASHAAANHGAAAPGTAKNAGGLEALFATLLAASGAAAANGEETAHADRGKDAVTRLAELLNGSAHIVIKDSAAGTDAVKPADAAKDKSADETKNGNTAPEILAELAALPAQIMATPNTSGIKKTAQPQDAGAIGATAEGHAGAQQAAIAQAGGKIADDAEKLAAPDAEADKTAAALDTDGTAQTAAAAESAKGLQTALAALQTQADKTLHQNVPAEKTDQALPLPAVAVAAKAGGQGENPASSNSGGRDTHSQDRHDGGASASAKPASAPAEAVATPPSVNGNAAPPASNPDAVLQTAPVHVSAALEVTSQSAAHPALQNGTDDRAVPLSNLGALAVTIAAKSLSGAKRFDIDLHPAELGSIHVRLSVEHSGLAQAHLTADNLQTLALLQRDSHTLERALKDAGLNLAGNGLNFSLKGEERETGRGPRPNGQSRNLSVNAIAGPAPAGTVSIDSLARDGVRLDIRV